MGAILCRMSVPSGDNAEMIILCLSTEQIDWIDSVIHRIYHFFIDVSFIVFKILYSFIVAFAEAL